MFVKTREDSRKFNEFYPDPVQRHKVHYWFAHQFLPKYVQQNPYAFFSYLFRKDLPGCPMEPTRFIQSRWLMFEQDAKLVPIVGDPVNGGFVFRRIAELSMSLQVVADKPVALVQMPKPEMPASAFFIAVVLLASPANPQSWPRDVQARVFTLEDVDADLSKAHEHGVVCEWESGGKHNNFGILIHADRDAFLRVVAAVLRSPAAPSAGSFDPVTGNIIFGKGYSPPPPQPAATVKKPWWKIWS